MTRRLPLLLPLLFPLVLAAPAWAAHHRHARSSGGGLVILTQQTGTALDQAARLLNADDIAGAVKRHEQPVVLIGSAPLSVRHGEAALFVQVQSASLCGSAGCSNSIFLKHGAEWTKVLDSVSGPIKVLSTATGGMHDVMVGDKDRWVWNGTTYRDTLPAAPIGNLRKSVERHQGKARESAAH